ncbi:FAD-binding protein [Sandarakinorhabdus sp. AAP62]|uniref:FAD-binding protein n=1 Tax=Sandarakinorhabdus sp. AAP62 TaxID=1248916 RepID=UPI000302745A|nr:FAD-binding protein [Sandarakinorhabdus sp. AAP62]
MASDPLPPDYYGSVNVTDWGLMVDYAPVVYFRPRDLDELASTLAFLIADPVNHGRIRILGGQHSCSDIFKSDIVIDLGGIPLEFTVDGNQVVASAWMHAHDFLFRAAQHGLSLTALGGTDAQTLAGLISTNTAGATIHASVYELVDWIEYLVPSGGRLDLRRVTRDEPAFQALICSLGCMGFLTRVGFTLVPQRFYQAGFTLEDNSNVLGNLQNTCDTHDFWRIEWLPRNDEKCLMWSAKAVAEAPVDGDYPADQMEALLKHYIKQEELKNHNGGFLDDALEAVYQGMIPNYQPLAGKGPMRLMIPCDRLAPLRCAMAEWSFNPADLARVQDVCRTYFNAKKWPNLAVEIECTRTDSYLMSPWNWPGLPYIIKFNFQYLTLYLDDTEKAAIVTHLNGLWDELNKAGIPFKAHWGKINFLTPHDVATRYQWEAFKPYVHPAFVNPYLSSRFGD